jgi:manganese/iron transport system permease protein
MEILGYQFMQNAIMVAFFGGIACSLIGVFVILTHMPFIGICMAHAAFAGALLALWLGLDPLPGAFALSLVAAAIIGPLADRGQLNPDTSLGIIFSLMLGLAFLFIGLMPTTKSGSLDLLWGNILTNTQGDVILVGAVAVVLIFLIIVFYKEIQATIFNRGIALSVGIPAVLVFYFILFLTGTTITVTLKPIGGLLIFSLILNPAAAAYQLTYSMKKMFIIAAAFGVLSGWTGLLFSYVFNLPSGAVIVLASSLVFAVSTIVSPKRKLKKFNQEAAKARA